jgi:amino acid transporter
MANDDKGGNSNSGEKKLTLLDACGMAIGGMVGGGIFAVLGEAAHTSGNAAFISLGLAGVLALLTGMSYVRLTLDFDESGGSFSYVEEIVGARFAGTVAWFLLLGYIFTVSLYAYTFGAYAGQLAGLGDRWNGYLGLAIILALAGLNLLGVRESGVTEDILVYTKVAILLVVAGVGFSAVKPGEALPIFEEGVGATFAAAGLIFVAYEGFQLLTYDYGDMENHHKTLPRAIYISIPVVILIYMLVAFVATGSMDNSDIASHKEIVLAYVAEPVMGRVGFVLVLIAAVFSTASAINATIFSSARLARRVCNDRQLPPGITRWQSGGVPVVFVVLSSLIAGLVQFTGTLNQITSFASLVFLLVFAVVNASAVIHKSFSDWRAIVPIVGAGGCLTAAVTLVVDLWRTERMSLWIVTGIAVVLLVLRVLYVTFHPHFLKRLEEHLGLGNDAQSQTD